jgi:hypothetical protein
MIPFSKMIEILRCAGSSQRPASAAASASPAASSRCTIAFVAASSSAVGLPVSQRMAFSQSACAMPTPSASNSSSCGCESRNSPRNSSTASRIRARRAASGPLSTLSAAAPLALARSWSMKNFVFTSSGWIACSRAFPQSSGAATRRSRMRRQSALRIATSAPSTAGCKCSPPVFTA